MVFKRKNKEERPPVDTDVTPQPAQYDWLRAAPSLDQSYGLGHFLKSAEFTPMDVSCPAQWLSGGATWPPDSVRERLNKYDHYGWGEQLAKVVARNFGLVPGDVVAISGGAGSGKTDFAMQLVDGLTLQSVEKDRKNLHPVLMLSSDPVSKISFRSLCRWVGNDMTHLRSMGVDNAEKTIRTTSFDSKFFNKPLFKIAMHCLGDEEILEEMEFLLSRKEIQYQTLAEGQKFIQSRSWIRKLQLPLDVEPADVLVHLDETLKQWKSTLQIQFPAKKIRPLVCIDSLQHALCGNDLLGSRAFIKSWMSHLVRILEQHEASCVLVSDGTSMMDDWQSKDLADVKQRASSSFGLFEGLKPFCTAMVLLQPYATKHEVQQYFEDVLAVICKSQWGSSSFPWPRFKFEGRSGRFFEVPKKLIDPKEAMAT